MKLILEYPCDVTLKKYYFLDPFLVLVDTYDIVFIGISNEMSIHFVRLDLAVEHYSI